jgi:hypothetical protein
MTAAPDDFPSVVYALAIRWSDETSMRAFGTLSEMIAAQCALNSASVPYLTIGPVRGLTDVRVLLEMVQRHERRRRNHALFDRAGAGMTAAYDAARAALAAADDACPAADAAADAADAAASAAAAVARDSYLAARNAQYAARKAKFVARKAYDDRARALANLATCDMARSERDAEAPLTT